MERWSCAASLFFFAASVAASFEPVVADAAANTALVLAPYAAGACLYCLGARAYKRGAFEGLAAARRAHSRDHPACKWARVGVRGGFLYFLPLLPPRKLVLVRKQNSTVLLCVSYVLDALIQRLSSYREGSRDPRMAVGFLLSLHPCRVPHHRDGDPAGPGVVLGPPGPGGTAAKLGGAGARPGGVGHLRAERGFRRAVRGGQLRHIGGVVPMFCAPRGLHAAPAGGALLLGLYMLLGGEHTATTSAQTSTYT